VNETDIVELELKSKKFNLSLKKKEALKQPEQTVHYQVCARGRRSPHRETSSALLCPPSWRVPLHSTCCTNLLGCP
jgi:hypothetical protein